MPPVNLQHLRLAPQAGCGSVADIVSGLEGHCKLACAMVRHSPIESSIAGEQNTTETSALQENGIDGQSPIPATPGRTVVHSLG